MDSSKFKTIIFMIISLIGAMYLGVTAATAQLETVIWVLGGVTLTVCLALGRSIWLMIPFMAAVDISLRIPGQPNTLLLAQLLVLIFFTFLFLLRRLQFKIRFTELEILMFALIAIVAQAYMRNPVGISIFGTGTVGGRNYFLFAITCASALPLCFLRISQARLITLYRVSVIGYSLNFIIGVAGHFIPLVGYYTGAFYALPVASGAVAALDPGQANRIGFLAFSARNFAFWICSLVSPVQALIKPLWVISILLVLAFAALSGYRSAIFGVIIIFAIGTMYRGGRGQVATGMFGAVALTVFLAFANAVFPLPPNIQRSLTFLPGTWDERYKQDADGSTEWRTEIWKEVIFTERWISNKVLGDGLGFTAAELRAQMNAADSMRKGVTGFDAHRENILSTGDYHSTAVSAVRTCGYIGLTILVIVMIRLAVNAHRFIKKCKNTKWAPLSLLLGLPPIVTLIQLPISANSFLQVSSATILSLSFLRIAQNNIEFDSDIIKE